MAQSSASPGGGAVHLSWDRLDQLVTLEIHRFRSWGLGPRDGADGDRAGERGSLGSALSLAQTGQAIQLIIDGSPASVAAILAAEELGLHAILVPHSRADDLLRLADRAWPGVGRVWFHGHEPVLEAKPTAGTPATDTDEAGTGLDWSSLASDGSAADVTLALEQGTVALFTSGSSSQPKLALMTWQACWMQAKEALTAFGGRQATLICSTPVAHAYALLAVFASRLARWDLVLAPGPALVSFLARSTATVTATPETADVPLTLLGAPSVYGTMLAYAQAHPEVRWRPINRAFSAGCPLSLSTQQRWEAVFGVPIRQCYGTTETGFITMGHPPTGPDTAAPAGTVGSPYRASARLAPVSHNVMLPEGWAGEICVRSLWRSVGYVVDGRLIPHGRWYRTGDAGRFLANTDVLVVGPRLRAVVHRVDPVTGASVAVAIADVEARLSALPTLAAVAVVQLPDGRLGALLVPSAPTKDVEWADLWDAAELTPAARPDVARYANALPTSAAGKILLSKVAEGLQQL